MTRRRALGSVCTVRIAWITLCVLTSSAAACGAGTNTPPTDLQPEPTTAAGTSGPAVTASVATPPAVAPAEQKERDRTEEDYKCASEPSCLNSGYCWAEGRLCVALYPKDCRHTLNCADNGECTLGNKKCVATRDDCANHIGCKNDGRCSEVDGHCAVSSDADCAKAEVCTSSGKCKYRAASPASIAICTK